MKEVGPETLRYQTVGIAENLSEVTAHMKAYCAEEFADFASRQTFPDGTNMLQLLHNDNYIKKFKTKDIMVTYGSGEDGRILLNKLNEMIAKEKGVSVKDLAKDTEASAAGKKATTKKKADAKETAAKE